MVKRWPNAIVKYRFNPDANFQPYQCVGKKPQTTSRACRVEAIQLAMKGIEKATCLRFEQLSSWSEHHVLIGKDGDCSSHIGDIGQ